MATMPANAVLVETTILVDFLRQSDLAVDYLDTVRLEGTLVCSAVTKAELIVGAASKAELRAIDQLLDRFHSEPIVAEDSVRALSWLKKYYHAHGVGFHDCLLAAAAARLHIPVVTLNEKHFKVLPGIKVIRPY